MRLREGLTMRLVVFVISFALVLPGSTAFSAAPSQDLVVANEADVTLFDPIRIQEAPRKATTNRISPAGSCHRRLPPPLGPTRLAAICSAGSHGARGFRSSSASSR
jgi:hypothetical protein